MEFYVSTRSFTTVNHLKNKKTPTQSMRLSSFQVRILLVNRNVDGLEESCLLNGFHPERSIFVSNAMLRIHANQLCCLQKGFWMWFTIINILQSVGMHRIGKLLRTYVFPSSSSLLYRVITSRSHAKNSYLSLPLSLSLSLSLSPSFQKPNVFHIL